MKKTILLTILSLSYFINLAQVIEKGKRILGGSIGFNLSQNTYNDDAANDPESISNDFSINLSPSLGKAVKNNLIFGHELHLGYSHSKNEHIGVSDGSKGNGYVIGAGVFLEKFYPITKSLSFSGYMPLTASYGTGEGKEWTNSSLFKTTSAKNFNVGISLSPSLNYSANKNFLIRLYLNDFIGLGYTHGTVEIKESNQTNQKLGNSIFRLSSSINNAKQLSSLNFGFSYIF